MLNSIAIVYWFVIMFIAFSMVLGHFYDNNMDTMVWCSRYGVVLYCNSTDFEFTDYGSSCPRLCAVFVLVHLCEQQHGHVCSKWVRMTPKDFLALLCQISSPPASSFQVKARLLCLLGKLFTDTACARTLALLHCCLSFSSHGFLVSFSSSFSSFSIFRCVLLMFFYLACFPAFQFPLNWSVVKPGLAFPGFIYIESWDSHACNCLHEASWPPCDQSWKRQPHEQSYLY